MVKEGNTPNLHSKLLWVPKETGFNPIPPILPQQHSKLLWVPRKSASWFMYILYIRSVGIHRSCWGRIEGVEVKPVSFGTHKSWNHKLGDIIGRRTLLFPSLIIYFLCIKYTYLFCLLRSFRSIDNLPVYSSVLTAANLPVHSSVIQAANLPALQFFLLPALLHVL